MALCLALPANHRAAGPWVLHISRCPNMNPQGWPGLWPDAQHSRLTPSGPLVCQVPAGTEVWGRAEERKRRKGLYGGHWWGCPGLWFSAHGVDGRSGCLGQRFRNGHCNSWVLVSVSQWNKRERAHWPTQAFLTLGTHLFPSCHTQHPRSQLVNFH